MTGFLARLKSAFQHNTNIQPASANTGIVLQNLRTISIEASTKGFYTSIFGSGDLESANQLSVPQKLIFEVVSRSLASTEFRLKAVPRLPSVIPRLLRSLRDSKASATDFVNIINKDPVMSAAVLRLSNSVYFNPRDKRIASIEVAVVKLGVEGLRSVLSAAVMQPVIQRQSPYFSQFGHKLWEHSLCCAVTCDLIAKQKGLEPYPAYLLGLVHDMGKITVFNELCQQYKANEGTNTGSGEPVNQPGYAAFAPLVHTMSPALSHTIARDWQLPEIICAALAEQIDIKPGRKVSPYGHALFLANYACEIYTRMTMRRENVDYDENKKSLAAKALQELSLPSDLFAQLDTLSIEI